MPYRQLYSLIIILGLISLSCEQKTESISGFSAPENDSVLISHIKEPLLTLIDLETNDIQMEIELPFIVSDMVYLEHLDTIVIASQDQTDLMYLNKESSSFESLISLEQGINQLFYIPETMELYASNSLHNELYRILYCDDGTTEIQIDQVKTGNHPSAIAYSPLLDRLYLSNVYDHQIEVFDRFSLKKLEQFYVIDRPNGLKIVDDLLFVGGHGTAGELNRSVHAVSLSESRPVEVIETGLMPVFFEHDQDNQRVLTINHGSHKVSLIDLDSMNVINEQKVSFNPYFSIQYQDEYMITTLDGHELVRLDKETLDIKQTVPLQPGPHSMIILEGTQS